MSLTNGKSILAKKIMHYKLCSFIPFSFGDWENIKFEVYKIVLGAHTELRMCIIFRIFLHYSNIILTFAAS